MSREENQDANAKKRKRDTPDASDPKLQEFLHLMQASKISPDELHGHQDVSALEPPTKKFAGAEESETESGDEYQSLPSGPNKRTRTPPPRIIQQPAKSLPSTGGGVGLSGNELVATNDANEEPADQIINDAPEAAASIDDDDWLRNRTNRLLDLADEGDIIPTAPQLKEPEPTERRDVVPITPSNIDPVEDGEPMVVTAEDTEESAAAAALDAVRKTARIFCRNLPYDATAEDLRTHFEKFGEVEEVRCCTVVFIRFYDEPQIGTAETFLMRTLGQYFSRCSGF